MAIQTATVGAAATTVYTSTNETAVTFLSICNYNTAAVTYSVNIVPSGDVVANGNLFIQSLEILPGDTYVVYQGGEKLVLANGDYISITASTGNVSSAIVSHVDV